MPFFSFVLSSIVWDIQFTLPQNSSNNPKVSVSVNNKNLFLTLLQVGWKAERSVLSAEGGSAPSTPGRADCWYCTPARRLGQHHSACVSFEPTRGESSCSLRLKRQVGSTVYWGLTRTGTGSRLITRMLIKASHTIKYQVRGEGEYILYFVEETIRLYTREGSQVLLKSWYLHLEV